LRRTPQARVKVKNNLETFCNHSYIKGLGLLSPLPFIMLNRLEVHHVISTDVTKVHHFNLLFGILDIPSELGAKVKASPSRLRVFPFADEAVDES
jgi:hypothetical protein